MDEQQLRALVRDAIARHLGPPAGPVASLPAGSATPPPASAHQPAPPASIAVARFVVARAPGETECVIEPSVTCNHCGHCLCYGH
jgi:hypothetical protein